MYFPIVTLMTQLYISVGPNDATATLLSVFSSMNEEKAEILLIDHKTEVEIFMYDFIMLVFKQVYYTLLLNCYMFLCSLYILLM